LNDAVDLTNFVNNRARVKKLLKDNDINNEYKKLNISKLEIYEKYTQYHLVMLIYKIDH